MNQFSCLANIGYIGILNFKGQELISLLVNFIFPFPKWSGYIVTLFIATFFTCKYADNQSLCPWSCPLTDITYLKVKNVDFKGQVSTS